MATKRGREFIAPWFVIWLPVVIIAGFIFVEEADDVGGAVLARAGVARKVAGAPAEAFGKLLDMGADHRATLTTRTMLASVLPRDVARDVASERFQHWTSRTPASYQLGMAGAPAVPLLAGLLDHGKERVRQQAAQALGDVGLAASAAAPALERLAKLSPPDSSSHAARNALGDVAPYGLSGWAWKIWYETPLAPALVLLFGVLAAAVFYPRGLRRQSPEDLLGLSPPAWVPPAAAVAAAVFLAFALTDLLGERFTVEADVWALAAGVWASCVAGVSTWIRRRAGLRPPASSRPA